jgi:hypothetical protein
MWINIVDNLEVSDTGKVRNKTTLKEYKIQKTKKGYLSIRITFNKIKTNYLIHRLVAKAFIPNPNNLETIDHINKNKEDNSVDNLRWMSREDNSKSLYWLGKCGENHARFGKVSNNNRDDKGRFC